jgi:cobalamin-dependent methionine synthase I
MRAMISAVSACSALELARPSLPSTKGSPIMTTRGWNSPCVGPRALLACPPDEEHDIPLMMLGIALGNRGWRITFLGARTPVVDLVRAVETVAPAIVVLASPDAPGLAAMSACLGEIAQSARVAIAGAGATRTLADACGAMLLSGDPIAAANDITTPK